MAEGQDRNITEKEAQELVRHFNEQSSGVHSFLTSVVRTDDTTKLGNLKEEEIGTPRISLRGLKELKLFSKEIAEENEWADYFDKLAEIQTSTSLSEKALLSRLAVTQKKELADMSPTPTTKKKNSGWFKSKKNTQEANPQQQP